MAGPDLSVFGRQRSFQDFERLQQEFDMQKIAQGQAAQINALQMKKFEDEINNPDVDKLGERAFMKLAQGLPLSAQEAAAAQVFDAKSGGISFNPVSGEMIQKPRISDRIGLPGMSNVGSQGPQGYQPSAPEQDFNINSNYSPEQQAPSGNMYDAMYQDALRAAAGNAKLEQEIKADYFKKKTNFSEGQSQAADYADRMRASDAILQDPKVTAAMMDLAERSSGSIPLIGGFLVSSDYQKGDQAKRSFINAILRRESGANIPKDEFESADLQYFPMPGDGEAVLAQKARNRQAALAGVSRAAGAAYVPVDIVDPYAGQDPMAANQAAAANRANELGQQDLPNTTPQQPQVGEIVDGHVFLGGDPSNPKSWKLQ